VADREKGKDIVRKAKAHSGLRCQWKKKKKRNQVNICNEDTVFSVGLKIN